MSDFRFARPRQPRRVILSIGYGLVAFVTLLALWLASGVSDNRAEMAQARATINRAAASPAGGGAALGADAFYTGDTPQLAQAALQTRLQELAESYGLEIDVIRADQIEQIDGFVRLNLSLNGVAPEAELGSFLHGLAAVRPMVVVKDLNLRRARNTRSDVERRVAFQTQLYGLAQR